VSRSGLDHLQHRMQDTDHSAERPILALVEAAKAIEVAKQLVGAVDEMNHAFVAAASSTRGLTDAKPLRLLRQPRWILLADCKDFMVADI
jgi:hypothetical protein